MTPTPVDGKTIAPPVSRVDKAPETATRLLTRIAFATEEAQRHLFWISLPIKIAFILGGTFIACGVTVGLLTVIASLFPHR